MLHHLNEVGDNLCLKFSRRKHNLTHPNFSDETDSQPHSWYDPSHPQFTAVGPNCPCCRGEQGNRALSAHTRGQCLAAAIFYMFGKQCFYNTLICAPFKEKKTIETFMKAFIGYNTHDMTPEELLDYSKTWHARCKNVSVLFHIKSCPPLTKFLSNHVRWQQYFCYEGDYFPHIFVWKISVKSFVSIFIQNFCRSFFASHKLIKDHLWELFCHANTFFLVLSIVHLRFYWLSCSNENPIVQCWQKVC